MAQLGKTSNAEDDIFQTLAAHFPELKPGTVDFETMVVEAEVVLVAGRSGIPMIRQILHNTDVASVTHRPSCLPRSFTSWPHAPRSRRS